MKPTFVVIAGPCVIESEDMVMQVAKELYEVVMEKNVQFYFKASFDKANRTSIDSYRGPGLEKGLSILQKVKDIYNIGIVTDIHEPWQAKQVAKVADIIQIPAFLCRQTDLLIAAAQTGKAVNVKKAQFMAPWDMKYVVNKLEVSGARQIFLCERGTSFGYNRLVVDMTSLIEMRNLGYPVIYDATHSVQRPGGKEGSSDGNRNYIPYLARAAASIGVDGIFAEVHPVPEHALSDGANMITIEEFKYILEEVLILHNMFKETR